MQRDKTRREDLTKVEGVAGGGLVGFEVFRDYKVVKEFPAGGAEADNFLIEKDGEKFFLKLYRRGIKPDIELLERLKEISRRYKKHLAEIIEVGYDEKVGRYYEVIEYVKEGSLVEFIKEISNFDFRRREIIIDKVIKGGFGGFRCVA